RDAGDAEVQAGGDLALERDPVALDVARPGGGGVALHAGIGGAGESADAFVGIARKLPLVERLAGEERIRIAQEGTGAGAGLPAGEAVAVVTGLRGVGPPAIGAVLVERLVDVFPAEIATLPAEHIDPIADE